MSRFITAFRNTSAIWALNDTIANTYAKERVGCRSCTNRTGQFVGLKGSRWTPQSCRGLQGFLKE